MESFDCEGCGYVITCRHYTLNNEHWHITCLTCTNCGNTFDEGDVSKIFNREGKVFCKECMTTLFQICDACGEPAKKFVSALGKIWHTYHFTCADCQNILDDYVEVNEKAYCQTCYQRLSARVFTTKKRRSFGTEKRQSGHGKTKTDSAKKPWTPSANATGGASKAGTPTTTSQSAKSAAQPRGWVANKKPPAVAANTAHSYSVPSPTTGAQYSAQMSSSVRSPVLSPGPSSSSPRTQIGSPSFTKSPALPASIALPHSVTSPRLPIGSPTSPTPNNTTPNPPLSAAAKAARRISGKYTPMPHPPLQSHAGSNGTPTTTSGYSFYSPSPALNASNSPTQVANVVATAPAKAPPSWMKSAPDKGQPGKRDSGKFSSNSIATDSASNNATNSSPSASVTSRPRSSVASPPVPATGTTIAHIQKVLPIFRGDGFNLSEILEAILRPLAEAEIGGIGYQAVMLLSQIHQEGRLHKNIRHTNIFINNEGIVSLGDDREEEKSDTCIKFKAPEARNTTASDIYSLGVALWTSADYLLDDEEEPALSVEFCDLIGLMTDDTPSNRPTIVTLTSALEKYKHLANAVLVATMKEVERKRTLKKEIQETIVQKQKGLIKLLVKEIVSGVKLRKVDRSALPPPVKSINPYEEMCLSIRDFSLKKLRKVDFSKLPARQAAGGPREKLLDSIRSKPRLKNVPILAGQEVGKLIPPVPNFPKYGSVYRDVTPLLRVPKATAQIAKIIASHFRGNPPDLFMATPTDCGIYFASLVADMLNRGVVILQNTGRLPRKMEKYSVSYETVGYAVSNMELQLPKYLLQRGEKVVVVDELLTNGGLIEAARHIVRDAGGTIQEVVCIAELIGYGGRAKLQESLFVLYQFDCTNSQTQSTLLNSD